MNALFADVLRARGASASGAAPDLASAQKAITTDLAAVADVEGHLGATLKTGDQFGALKTDVGRLASPQASDDAYTSVVADIQALIAQVGDGSSLILDPALDSFYVMDIVVVELPNLQDLSGRSERSWAASRSDRPSPPTNAPTCAPWPSRCARVWMRSNAVPRSPSPAPRTLPCNPNSACRRNPP